MDPDNTEITEWIQPDGHLHCLSPWVSWYPRDVRICLDGEFTIEELEALVSYMRA